MQSPNARLRFCVGVILVFCALVFVYFVAYAAIGKRGTITGPRLNGQAQFFSYRWQVVLFAPAAWVESMVRGDRVSVQQWDVEE